MEFGFQTFYSGSTRDGKNWTAVEPLLSYLAKDGSLYRLKLGAATDGPTGVPEWVEEFVLKDLLWMPAAFHDGCYKDMVEVCGEGGGWFPFHPTKEQSDDLFMESMESQGISEGFRVVIYEAVVLGGVRAWKEDRGE